MAAVTVAEVYIAIIGACGITLRPVYRYLRYGDAKGSSTARQPGGFSGNSRTIGARTIGRLAPRGKRERSSSFEILGEDEEMELELQDQGSQTRIVCVEGGKGRLNSAPSMGIRVERDLTWMDSRGV